MLLKWKIVKSGLWTGLNSVLGLSMQSLAKDQGGS